MNGYIYLASPYSHPSRDTVSDRYVAAMLHVAKSMREGEHVFSPIVHCHEAAQVCSLPGDYEYWKGYNRTMIQSCAYVRVLMLEGWEKSKGVRAEIALAMDLGRPLSFVDDEGQAISLKAAQRDFPEAFA